MGKGGDYVWCGRHDTCENGWGLIGQRQGWCGGGKKERLAGPSNGGWREARYKDDASRVERGGGARERFYGEYRSCIDASQQNRHRRAHQLREDSTAPPSGITMTGHLIKLEYRSHPTHPCDEANSTYVLLDAGGTTGVVF